MRKLSDDPRYLRQRFEQLSGLRRTMPTAEVLEALAECAFRLAVMPATEPAKALELLSQAARWDRGNPKYGYHIARLLLVHGDLDRGGAQLEAVLKQCRTSHRIWAHLALVQRELEYRYSSDSRYERRAMADRSAKLLELVRDGADMASADNLSLAPVFAQRAGAAAAHAPVRAKNGDPDTAPPRRVIDPGECRWTGVYDLRAEQLLEAEPSTNDRDRLAAILKELAGLEAQRHAGFSGFVIASIQWLFSGYPTAQTRRLLAEWPPDSIQPTSSALLREICDLMEVAEVNLPARMAERMAAGVLPPALAVVIHDRRLLYRGSRMADYWGSYLAARRFVDRFKPAVRPEEAEEQKSEAIRLQQELKTAADHLEDCPQRVADTAQDDSPTAATAEIRMQATEHRAEVLKLASNALWDFLRELDTRVRSLAAEQRPQFQADHNGASELVNLIESEVKAGLDELEGIRRAIEQGGVVERFPERNEKCTSVLTTLNRGRFDNKLMRIAALAASPGGSPPAPTTSPALTVIRDTLSQTASTYAAMAEPPLERVHTLAAAAKSALAMSAEKFTILKAIPAGKRLDSAQYAQFRQISEFVAAMDRDSKQALEELDRIRSAALLAPNAIQDLDAAENANRALANEPSRFKRRIGQLDSTPPDSPQLDGIARHLAVVAAPSAAGDPVTALRAAIAMLDGRVDAIFTAARQTFDAYGPVETQAAAIADLRRRVLSTQAAALYSFGRRHAARKLWLTMSHEDRLNPGPLHNIAVSYTTEGDSTRALLAWQACAEAEYFQAILAGTPKSGAESRTVLHSELGAAFGFASLLSDQHPLKVEASAAETAAFLSSTARVRAFVDHHILSFWNDRLDVTSPPVFLGVGRTAPERLRTSALEEMKRWAIVIWELLPPRVADQYAQLCWDAIREAAANCGSVRRLTRQADPEYDRDEKHHQEWLGRVIELKARLTASLLDNQSVLYRLESLDALAELVRLDEIPIDSNTDWRDAVARSYVPPNEFEGLQKRLRTTCERLILNAVAMATSPSDVGKLGADRGALYQRIAQGWFGHSLFEPSRELFDDPGRFPGFYSDAVTEAFAEGATSRVIESATNELAHLTEVVPRSGGPARLLGVLLSRSQQYTRASEVLGNAIDKVVSADGRKELERTLAQVKVNGAVASVDKDPAGAFEAMLGPVSRRELEQEDLPDSLANIAIKMALKTKEWTEYRKLRDALRSWYSHKPADKEASLEETKDTKKPVTDEVPWIRSHVRKGLIPARRRQAPISASVGIQKDEVVAEILRPVVVKEYRHLNLFDSFEDEDIDKVPFDPAVDPHVINYLLAATGMVGENAVPRWSDVYKAMRQYSSRYNCPSAYYWRMMAAWNLATASAGIERDNYLRDAEADAEKVIAGSKEERELENAKTIVENIKIFRARSGDFS